MEPGGPSKLHRGLKHAFTIWLTLGQSTLTFYDVSSVAPPPLFNFRERRGKQEMKSIYTNQPTYPPTCKPLTVTCCVVWCEIRPFVWPMPVKKCVKWNEPGMVVLSEKTNLCRKLLKRRRISSRAVGYDVIPNNMAGLSLCNVFSLSQYLLANEVADEGIVFDVKFAKLTPLTISQIQIWILNFTCFQFPLFFTQFS